MVLDASAALAWLFAEAPQSLVSRTLDTMPDEPALVPAHWTLEVTNGLRMAVRRKRVTPDDAEAILERIAALPVSVDSETWFRGWAETWALSRQFGLTTYDAAYLELALRRGLPLATLDDDLRRAAAEVGVAVLD